MTTNVKPRSTKVKFSSRDSLKLHGTLLKPAVELRGMMLMVHGITSDRDEWGIFELLADMLAAQGIASLRFDFRGHGESKLDEDLVSLMGILSDVVSAWDKLEKLLGTKDKPLKRYIIGSSFGGGFAYAAASRYRQIDRVFLLAPVFDYLTDIGNCAPHWHRQLKHKGVFDYNDLTLGRAMVNEAFFFDPLDGPAVPATIFHGTKDRDVSIELSRAALARQPMLELIAMKGAGHVLNLPDDFDLEEQRSWDFIRAMADMVVERVT